jgi:UDP-GlcNAc:undecaprenyl-phosphate GlcNAc-1-phosphate transferase
VTRRRAALRSVVAAAVLARGSYRVLDRIPAASRPSLQRRNYRDAQVSLLGGPALVVGAAAALARMPAGRLRRGALVALLGAGLCGGFDDVVGNGSVRGLRGHLGALARGRPTTGAAKILGIGLSGLAGGALVTEGGVATAVPAGLAVAAAANVANLFDLRPGRAGKLALLVGVPLALAGGPGGQLAAVASGSAIGLLAPDLDERTMFGDAGANALGALLGIAAVTGASRRRCCLTLGALLAVTAAGDAVSFSAVIDRVPALRFVDRLGRLPDA